MADHYTQGAIVLAKAVSTARSCCNGTGITRNATSKADCCSDQHRRSVIQPVIKFDVLISEGNLQIMYYLLRKPVLRYSLK